MHDCNCAQCLALERGPWWVRPVWGFIIFCSACLLTWMCW